MPIASAPVSKLLLRNVRLFAGLPESQLELLASVAQRRSFAKGDKIFAGGEHAMSLHLIVTGKVQVVFADKHGAEVILDILNPGEYFGEMALIDELPRSATIVARESCEILILSKKDFLACLQGNFQLTMALQRGLVKRLRGANSRIGSLALLDVQGRVAKVLLEMAETVNGRKVARNLSQQDIAKIIGASREMVGRMLNHMQSRGQIKVEGATIVLNPPAPDSGHITDKIPGE
jgi:CRP/FNR family cyclic AMP-dependent transcriptional regulator